MTIQMDHVNKKIIMFIFCMFFADSWPEKLTVSVIQFNGIVQYRTSNSQYINNYLKKVLFLV